MKYLIATAGLLTLLMAAGCSQSNPEYSPQGGIATNNQDFTIEPPPSISMKQGEIRQAMVVLDRGNMFKQDVKVVLTAQGITVSPSKTTVKAGEKPNIPLTIETPADAAIGTYRVSINATPETGAAANAAFNVTVTAP